MTPRAPQAPRATSKAWRRLAAVGTLALCTAGCPKRGPGAITGSIPNPQPATPEIWRRHADVWGPRFDANPSGGQDLVLQEVKHRSRLGFARFRGFLRTLLCGHGSQGLLLIGLGPSPLFRFRLAGLLRTE